MSLKNWVIERVVSLFQRKRGGEHFLIVSTTGLGDTLWATPAIRDLKESFPSRLIYVLTSKTGREVLSTNPHIEKCFVIRDALFSFIPPFWKLRKLGIGTALIFHASQRIALPFCALLGIPRIIGSIGFNKGLDALLTVKVPPCRAHEIVRRQNLVRAAGATPKAGNLELPIPAKRTLTKTQKTIGIHPGAKDPFKQYPLEFFAQIGIALSRELNARVLITGSSHEQPLMQALQKRIPGALTLPLALSIPELAAHILDLILLITNDTGPMHIAFAINTPTIALFAPTDPTLCGPHEAKRARALAASPTCTPCLKKKCRDGFCLRQIPPERVITQALELLTCCALPSSS